MRVLYVGVHSGKGWRTEYWVLKALKRLGCKVKLHNYRRARKRVKELSKRIENLVRLEQLFKPDLILVQRADNCPPELFSELKSPKALWSTEPINRNRDIDQLFEANVFDHYFVHTFSCLERINNEFPAIRNKTSRLEYGCPPELIRKPKQAIKKQTAVFNRSLSPRRENWFKPFLSELTIFQGRFGRKYFADIQRSLISVNVHYSDESTDDFETGIFEAMAVGSLVITETVDPRIITELQLEDSIIVVSSPEEMAKQILFFKENLDKAFAKILKAHHAIQKNTWDVRMKQIFKTVGLNDE